MISIFHTEEPLTPIELEAEEVRKEGTYLRIQVARLLEDGSLWRAKREAAKNLLSDEISIFPRKEKGFLCEISKYQLHAPEDLYVAKDKILPDGTKERRKIELFNTLTESTSAQYLSNWVKSLPILIEAEKQLAASGIDFSLGKRFEFIGTDENGDSLVQHFGAFRTGFGPPANTAAAKRRFTSGLPGDYSYTIYAAEEKTMKLVAEYKHKVEPK